MLKVLYITNIPSPYRVDFFNELNKYCKLTVLFERRSAKDRDDSWYNNNFEFQGLFLHSKNIGKEASLSFDVIKYLKQEYDIIILGGYSSPTSMIASLYMKLHKIPYVLNADGGFINYSEKKINKLVKTFFISSASYWLSTGVETSKYFAYYGAKKDEIYNYHFSSIKKEDILLLPVSLFEKQKLRKELKIKYDKVILTIGQFIPRKGFDWLIESYQNLNKNIGIFIIGGKPTNEYLKLKQIYAMDNLQFIDFQDKQTLKKWYQASDLFVLPTKEDIWGLVINEAISQGLPVITTDRCVAGMELIHDEKNGFIIRDFDSEELKNKTDKILYMNPEDYSHICKNNLIKSEDYTIERMALDHYEIFKRLKGMS